LTYLYYCLAEASLPGESCWGKHDTAHCKIVHAFIDFRTHTIKEPDWNDPAEEET